MGKKQSVLNRQYTDEFKVEAVRLGESLGGNQAAKRLGVPESSLWNWMRLSRAGKLKAPGGATAPLKRSVTEVEAENARLRKELASTKLDLEIVKNVWSAPALQVPYSPANRTAFCVNVFGLLNAATGCWPRWNPRPRGLISLPGSRSHETLQV